MNTLARVFIVSVLVIAPWICCTINTAKVSLGMQTVVAEATYPLDPKAEMPPTKPTMALSRSIAEILISALRVEYYDHLQVVGAGPKAGATSYNFGHTYDGAEPGCISA